MSAQPEPNPQDPRVLAEARRQTAAIAHSPTEAEDQAFIDAVTDWPAD